MSRFAQILEADEMRQHALDYILTKDLTEDFITFVLSVAEAEVRRIMGDKVRDAQERRVLDAGTHDRGN